MVAWVAARFAGNVNTAIRLRNRMEFMIFYGDLGRNCYGLRFEESARMVLRFHASLIMLNIHRNTEVMIRIILI